MVLDLLLARQEACEVAPSTNLRPDHNTMMLRPSAAAAKPQAGREHRRWVNAHNLKLHFRPMENSPSIFTPVFERQQQPPSPLPKPIQT